MVWVGWVLNEEKSASLKYQEDLHIALGELSVSDHKPFVFPKAMSEGERSEDSEN